MASSEKEIIPLSDVPPKHDSESIADKPSTSGTTNLVPAKYPSRPRRKVVVAVVVIVVVVFVIIAATLIGKYLPEYLRDAEDKPGKGTRDGEAEDPKASSFSETQVSPTATTETKILLQITSRVFQHTPVSPLPELTTFATVTLSSRSDISTSSPSSVVADLSVIANLLPNTESKWSRWSLWSDCTQTCGTGTRHRKRTCVAINDKEVFAPISCAGKSNQIKSCAEWKCPDCSRNCTTGTLNSAYDACTCSHHKLSGRVLTEDDIPLSEANISLAETPYNIIAETNISGYFVTLGVCAVQKELLVAKSGFVPVKLTANVTTPTTANIAVKMEIAVAPFVTVHPESKVRMPGQSVTFCCVGVGNPPPEIEWFKENNVIDKSFYNYNNTLEINDVQGLNGSYRCRAINQFGSEFSSKADLVVLENSEDSCSSMPISSYVSLPPGCFVNGTNPTTVDFGECEPIACVRRGVNFTSSCSDPPLCCSPLFFESVAIKCGVTISFEMSVVKRCGCGKCNEKQTIISGVAIGQNGNPASSVDLVFGGKSVGSTDAKGKFSLPVPETTKRAIVTFKDLIHKKFVEEEKIFVVEESQTAIYTVKLREKPAPFIFNASEPLDVPLGSDSSDGFADLELPENALLNEDGSVFKGNAKATVSVTDPRNQSDIESAPGDFSAMSEDGEEEILQTFGMIKVNLEDDNGKPLTMSKPMKVYLDPEKLNLTASDGNVSVKLYWLDKKTGRWRVAGEFKPEDGQHQRRRRSKRLFLEGTVTPSLAKRNLNFDTPKERVALRVTVPGSKNDEDGAVLVRVGCIKPPKGYIEQITKRGVACISIWRDAECFVQASRGNNYYTTGVEDTSAQQIFGHVNGRVKSITGTGHTITYYSFVSSLIDDKSTVGPTYSVEPSGKNICEASLNSSPPSNQEKSRQFVFKKPADEDTKPLQLLHKNLDMKWTSAHGDKCFIKVEYTGKEKVVFMATSYEKKNFDVNAIYGYHLNTTQFISGKNVVCLQFKCPIEDKPSDIVFLLLTPINSKISGTYDYMNAPLTSHQKSECEKGKYPDVHAGKGQEKRLCITYSWAHLFQHGNSNICLADKISVQIRFKKGN